MEQMQLEILRLEYPAVVRIPLLILAANLIEDLFVREMTRLTKTYKKTYKVLKTL
jgi:hypothetical protein